VIIIIMIIIIIITTTTSSCPTPKLEDCPLSAVCDCFSIFTATLYIWRPSPPSTT
jgi:hypothetical protein